MPQPLIAQQSLEWLLEAATEAVLIVDAEGHIVLANPAAHRLFGFAEASLPGRPIDMLVPDRLRHAHQAQRASYGEQPRPREMGAGLELFARHADGSEFPVEVSLSPLAMPGAPSLVMATIHDIRLRKQAELALQESEARMRAIFETAVDAIITIDERGQMERLNPAAERLFGYREAELVGRNVSTLMPEPHRSAHDGYLHHYMRTGEQRIIGKGREVAGQRKDGSVFPMDLAVAEMRLGTRRMFTGIVRDITERKNAIASAKLAEAALLQSQDELRRLANHQDKIKEQERKRIAQEIHDELGGLLTGIKAYVSVLRERALQAGGVADPLLAETSDLAQTAIETVRRVITDLRPSVLDQLGIWAALEWYAEQVQQRTGIRCSCRIDAPVMAVELGAERSTMLFRIAQEALTNVARHAQASEASITVVREASALVMTVWDNGRGIDTEGLLDRESWGILGMHERSRHFGGELTITGNAGQGTTLQLRLPTLDDHDN